MQFAACQPSNAAIRSLIDTCRAELAAASCRYRLATASRAWDHEIEQAAAAHRLPHEQAAAILLNVWGHLHPIEARAVEIANRLVLQRRAGWTSRADGTLADLRRYLAARAELRRIFDAAAADYLAARAAVDVPIAA